MKKITLLFAALFCLMTVSAKTIYFKPNNNWNTGGAWFTAWTFGGSGDDWVDFTDSNGDGIFEGDVPNNNSKFIFLRMAPGATTHTWSGGDNGVWNRAEETTLSGDYNLYTITEGEWGDNWQGDGSNNAKGTWSTLTLYSFTIKFLKPFDWNAVCIFVWDAGENNTQGWPGKLLEPDADGWYSYSFTNVTDGAKFIFNNNNNGIQTIDLSVADIHEDGCYTFDTTNKNLVAIDCDTKRVTEIKLSDATLKLQPNHTYQLSVTNILPEDATNKAVTWSTSDENIAKVESGRIKALAVGEAKITATAKDGSGVKAECVVTVSEDEDALAGITLNFKKHEDWEKVYLWAWTKVNGANFNFFESWPGKEITNADAEGVYSYTFDANYSSISFILNNGPQAEGVIILQTTDITIEENTCVSVSKMVEGEGDEEKVTYASTIVDCNTWKPAVIHVETLAWYEGSEPRAEIAVGDIEYVNIAINPNTATNQTLQFESSEAGIVSGTIERHPTGGYPVLTIEALAEGKTTITITSEDNKDAKLSYSLTVVKPIETVLENAEVEAKAIKVIENGQLIIIRDGVRYNVLGGIIK